MRVDFNIRLGRIQLQGINLYPQKSYEAFQSWSDLWQPTPVFLPGESYGQKSLAGYSPWGHKESDTTEQLMLPTLTLPPANVTTFGSRIFKVITKLGEVIRVP